MFVDNLTAVDSSVLDEERRDKDDALKSLENEQLLNKEYKRDLLNYKQQLQVMTREFTLAKKRLNALEVECQL